MDTALEIKRMKMMLRHQEEKYAAAVRQVYALEEQLKAHGHDDLASSDNQDEINAAKKENETLRESIARY